MWHPAMVPPHQDVLGSGGAVPHPEPGRSHRELRARSDGRRRGAADWTRAGPARRGECGTSMEPRWNLDLRRTCRSSPLLACSMTIELRPKRSHLRRVSARPCEAVKADDGSRTRDLRLGKPTLYQLSYVRAVQTTCKCRCSETGGLRPGRILPPGRRRDFAGFWPSRQSSRALQRVEDLTGLVRGPLRHFGERTLGQGEHGIRQLQRVRPARSRRHRRRALAVPPRGRQGRIRADVNQHLDQG